jgi:hypothetical protein
MTDKPENKAAGRLKQYRKADPVSTEAMDEAVAQYLRDEYGWDEWFDNPQVMDDFMPEHKVIKEIRNKPTSEKSQQILASLRKVAAEALERKRRLGQYAVIWRDGKVVLEDEDAPDEPQYLISKLRDLLDQAEASGISKLSLSEIRAKARQMADL